jgi:hypothetical protein
MGFGFVGGDEARADPDAVGARRQRRRHRPPRADAAGGQHRDVDDRQHSIQQRQQAEVAADVAACLDALSDDQIASRGRGRPGFLG